MKKFALLVAIATTMVSGRAMAQNVNLPSAGAINTEVQFNPFNDNEQFKLDGVKIRYFLTDKDAVRLKLGFEMNNKNTYSLENPGEDADDVTKALYNYCKDNGENKAKTGKFSIDLGYERHILTTGRLDLYAGVELGIETAWSNTNKVEGLCEKKEDNSLDFEKPSSYNFYTVETETKSTDGYFAFRAGIFTGLDFYLYKGLYVGTELGLNFNNKSFKDGEMTTTNNAPSIKNDERVTRKDITNNSSETSLKFEIVPTLRLGWSF